MHGLVHLIIWLLSNRVTRSGSVLKTVRCENCTLCYEYEMRRTVKLEGLDSEEVLAKRAEQTLWRKLADESDPIPCPACGWYQRHMVEQARRDAARHVPAWVGWLVVVTALLSTCAVLSAADPNKFGPVGFWTGTVAGIGGGLGLLILVVFIVSRLCRRVAYNPNATRWRNEEQDQ
jgi:hypothetical protein